MPVAGVDIGSLTTEAVVLTERRMLAGIILATGANSRAAADKALELALEESGLAREELEFVVATGYGRVSAPFANKKITEITCHGCGAFFLDPGVRTVIDVGGQDSKVIRINEEGRVLDFVMNDKCAAGTGRFLEVMADALEVSLKEVTELAAMAKEAVPISSMCTVFAESEVVSLIAEGHNRQEILKGITASVAERTAGMAHRVGIQEKLMMTGGVALNGAVVEELQKVLGTGIAVPDDPQLVGALGAAVLAEREINNRST